nr:MAG TPA: hypothetical protein [Caudoviricetes sp.]
MTYEGIDTDAGFNAAKKWLLKNMKEISRSRL